MRSPLTLNTTLKSLNGARLAGLRESRLKGLWVTLRKNLFGSWYDAVISVSGLLLVSWALKVFVYWAVVDAVWTVSNADLCAKASGACWSVIDARYRLILFGLYPYGQQWRSALACAVIILVIILSCIPVFWTGKRMSLVWIGGFLLFNLLMRGGMLGLSYVPTGRWGGLSLTLYIFSAVIVIGMPLSIVLALMRRTRLPVIRWMAYLAIDFTRSVPLITILFAAVMILPIVLPEGLQGNAVQRVILAFAFFFSCYQAEVVRGGLQSVSHGQHEAALALGLSNWQRLSKVILPQAFRNSLPATINQFVITFKDTSVVVIVGLFDLMGSAKAAFQSGTWAGAYVEVYTFVGLLYFIFVLCLSRYGAYLERKMRVGDD